MNPAYPLSAALWHALEGIGYLAALGALATIGAAVYCGLRRVHPADVLAAQARRATPRQLSRKRSGRPTVRAVILRKYRNG